MQRFAVLLFAILGSCDPVRVSSNPDAIASSAADASVVEDASTLLMRHV